MQLKDVPAMLTKLLVSVILSATLYLVSRYAEVLSTSSAVTLGSTGGRMGFGTGGGLGGLFGRTLSTSSEGISNCKVKYISLSYSAVKKKKKNSLIR